MLVIAFLFISAVSVLCHADPPTATVLHAITYPSFVNTSARGSAIVVFCERDQNDCDRFLREIQQHLKGRTDIRFGAVDVQAEWLLVDTVGIRGLPGLVMKNHNRLKKYSGSIEALFKSLDWFFQPRIHLLETVAQINDHVEKQVKRRHEVTAPVVMFTASDTSEPFEAIVNVAHDDHFITVFNFAATHEAALLGRGDGKAVLDGTVALYRPEGYSPRVVYGIAKTVSELKSFLSRSIAKPVEELTATSAHRVHLRNQSMVYFFFDIGSDNAQIMDVATALAVRYEATVSFAWYSMDIAGGLPRDMGLLQNVFPCVAMQGTGHEYYPYVETLPMTVEGIAAFIDSVLSRAVQHHLRSEPIPEIALDPADGFIRAVGWTVEDLVLRSPKRFVVLLTVSDMVHCPLCNHTMENIEKVRRRIATPDDVAFVKIDPTLNHMPDDLLHEVLFPGFLVRDNVKKTITIAKGRKSSVAALEDFFSTFFEVLPQAEEEKSATLELNAQQHDCFSTKEYHDFHKRLSFLTEQKIKLNEKWQQADKEGRQRDQDEL